MVVTYNNDFKKLANTKKYKKKNKRRKGHARKFNSSMVIHSISALLENSLAEKNKHGSGTHHEPAAEVANICYGSIRKSIPSSLRARDLPSVLHIC